MRLDMPLHGNNARGAKYVVYCASIVMHTVFENIKWLHSCCVGIKKAQSLPLRVYSLGVLKKNFGYRCAAGSFDYHPIAKPQTNQICNPH